MKQVKIIEREGITFDDVLIIPNYTQVKRGEIDISTCLTSKIKLKIPLISSPMDTVTGSRMAIALGKLGGLGIIHRNLSIEDQVKEVKLTKKEVALVAAAVGIGRDLEERVAQLVKHGINLIVIDSAHGFSEWVIAATRFISQTYPQIALVAGNIATGEAALKLIEAGVKILRVGLGPGSICTTRVITGIGVPQITAITEVAEIAKKHKVSVIADGGLRTSGDIVKALAAEASAVMSGSLFAGSLETPGEIIEKQGKKYKSYRGMGSISAMKQGSAARYGQEYRIGQEKKLIAEGIEGLVPIKASVEEIVKQLVGGLKSGMYYAGAKNIAELQTKARFMKISRASLIEGYPHDIIIKS